ncbi:MAG: tetratricopeptide repeat protein [Myxococcales bacterium]|nr:tetratricopeptide repeat protein [Myxococcales bacterium]
MGWFFWKSRGARTAVEDEVDVEGAGSLAARTPVPEFDPEAPRLGGFLFDFEAHGAAPAEAPSGAGDTQRSPVAPEPELNVHAVVRHKARRSRRRGLDASALGVRPIQVPSLRELAVVYREAARQRTADRPLEAVAFWQAYLALRPDDGAGWVALGQGLLSTQQREAAWGAFVEARGRLPDDPLPAGALGYLSEASGDLQGAIEHYRDAVERAPDDPVLLGELARVQGKAGRTTEARQILERRARLLGGA